MPRAIIVLFILLVLTTLASGGSEVPLALSRDSRWAEPLTIAGLPNLHKVSDTLYRSAQPDKDGFAKLKNLGVKTVVSLRSFHSERENVKAAGLNYEHIFMKTWHPEEEDVVRFLKIAIDPDKTPVLVHCQHGADRTGTMSALYRIVVQGWSKEQAIKEMTEGGYGFHTIWQNLPDWITRLDVERIRKEVGISP